MWGWTPQGIPFDVPVDMPGYCGEASLQVVALEYGNYISQAKIYEVEQDSFLLGINDVKIARVLGMKAEGWDSDAPVPQSTAFLAWVQKHLKLGRPVIVGLFDMDLASTDYDHICPIIGTTPNPQLPSGGIYYDDLFHSEVRYTSDIVKTRAQCKKAEGSDPYCLDRDVNYGVVVTGNLHASLPVKLRVADLWKDPEYNPKFGRHDKAVALQGTLIVSGLTAGQSYTCLRFDHPGKLPKADANLLKAGSHGLLHTFVAKGTSHTMPVNHGMMSNGSYFFRCVPSA